MLAFFYLSLTTFLADEDYRDPRARCSCTVASAAAADVSEVQLISVHSANNWLKHTKYNLLINMSSFICLQISQCNLLFND